MSTRTLIAALLAATLALTACAGGDGTEPGAGDTDRASPDTPDDARDEDTATGDERGDPSEAEEADGADPAFPVTIEHRHGETTIDERPERVVTVGLTDQDAVLALGVQPVGTNDWYGGHAGGVWPWAQDLLEDEPPTVVARSIEIDFEAVAALEPDVILALYAGIDEQVYETLSGIAPTVAQPEAFVDYGVPWQEQARITGQVLGLADEAEQLVADTEAEVAAVREEHPELDGATLTAATDAEGVYVYAPSTGFVRMLTSLGPEVPAKVDELVGDADGAALSLERVELLENDVMVWLDVATDSGPVAEPVYTALDVHEQGREVFLATSGELGGGGFISVLSVPVLAEALAPALSAAVDGDPSSEVPPID
jgi:iron complex transport system substrate-binding protein